jgi:protein tyrosine phosphatase (PTP) superfamily phosphohydrolase (DUF442 family)
MKSHMRRAFLMSALGFALLPPRLRAQASSLAAPNVVVISPRLVTSGQPAASALAQLASQGFGAVIYLAPPTVSDAVRDEAAILERQGVAYMNIPIPFNHPTEAHFDSFSTALTQVVDRKVLVHCQVNMRASSMVFLHRVIIGREDAELAYESVARVWSPTEPWKTLMEAMLRKHGNAFEPL